MENKVREKKLIKNTLIISIGKLCTQLITFFLLPLYTGILTTSEYGVIDLLNTIVSLMLPLVTFQIDEAVFRYLIENRNSDEEIKKIISSSFFTLVIQNIIYSIIFIFISKYINNDYKYFLMTNVISHIFSSFFLQIARGIGDNNKYTVGCFISAISTIVFNILFLVVFDLRATGMLLGTFLGKITCALYLFYSVNIFKYIDYKKVEKTRIKELLKYSIPLIPNTISWWVFNASDKIIVSSMLGLTANGILSAAHKFSNVYITFYNIFNMSWTENVSLHINDKDIKDYFNNMFNVIIKLFISMAIGMIAVMPFVFPLMVNEKFHEGYKLIPILILSSFFNVIVGLISVLYVAKKNSKEVAITSLQSAMINIVVHLVCIKFMGLYAAVFSTLISFMVMSLRRLINVNKEYFKIDIERMLFLKSFLILAIVVITYYINNIVLNIFSLIFSILYACVLNRNSFELLLDIIKGKFLKKVKHK